jgi:hypothetical protein
MENAWLAPWLTSTEPLGEIAPFAPALAAMVYVGTNNSPIAKSPKPVTPRACVVVAVRTPKFVDDHALALDGLNGLLPYPVANNRVSANGAPYTSYAQVNVFFDGISKDLLQKYGQDSVMVGCIEPLKLAVIQSQ